MVRLGGGAFSAFTRGMDKSFDARMSDIKHGVTAHPIEQTQACIGYTQSDSALQKDAAYLGWRMLAVRYWPAQV